MPGKLKVTVRDSIVTFDFSEFSIDSDILLDRIDEITPVLQSVIEADVIRSLADDDLHARLLPLILAKDLMYQAYLHKAQSEAKAMEDVLMERVTASQAGFPEFSVSPNHDD